MEDDAALTGIGQMVGTPGYMASPDFRAVITRATAREREHRFQHAADILAALNAVPELRIRPGRVTEPPSESP